MPDVFMNCAQAERLGRLVDKMDVGIKNCGAHTPGEAAMHSQYAHCNLDTCTKSLRAGLYKVCFRL